MAIYFNGWRLALGLMKAPTILRASVSRHALPLFAHEDMSQHNGICVCLLLQCEALRNPECVRRILTNGAIIASERDPRTEKVRVMPPCRIKRREAVPDFSENSSEAFRKLSEALLRPL